MEKWNVAICTPSHNEGASLFLRNRSKTLVSVNKRLHFDPIRLFERLEKIKFPLKYTTGLEKIHFSVLTGDARGYYMDNRIWVDVSQKQVDHVLETFVHEVGHHVEEQECIASLLHKERVMKSKRFYNMFSERSDDEYFAIGFEEYYTERPETRRTLRKMNPMLYRAISLLHREYHLKG